jgi:hypothetical protein
MELVPILVGEGVAAYRRPGSERARRCATGWPVVVAGEALPLDGDKGARVG